MADATFVEVRSSPRHEIDDLCLRLVRAFTASLVANDPRAFDAELQQLVAWLEQQSEDAYAWQAAFSTLRRSLPDLLAIIQTPTLGLADRADR